MQTLTLEEAQARLPELIAALPEPQEFTITRDGENVAQIAVTPASKAKPAPRSILDLKPMSVGKVLKTDFNRFEVWDEIYRRED
jgi:antitoxin (DNA-binding transcriptional repressor) of toxin-antitoxin stability system